MLETKKLTLTLTGSGRKLVEDFTFTLNRGEKAVLIGEEGNGKSTFLRCIYDPESVAAWCDVEGIVRIKGRAEYLEQSLSAAAMEGPVSALFRNVDGDALREALMTVGLPPETASSKRRVATLSGGERVKARLAAVLASSPDVLLLDEPTNDLDLDTLAWLEGFLSSTKLPVLFVSHDETLIERVADIIIHMEQLHGKSRCRVTVARMGYNEYVSTRRASLDHQDQVARKQREDQKRRMERWRQIHDRVEHEQNVISRGNPSGGAALKKKMRNVQSQERRFEREAEDFEELVEEEAAILTRFEPDVAVPNGKVVLDLNIQELSIGGRALARDIKLKVTGPAHIGIISKNGAGKTTLLREIWDALRDRRDIIAAYMPQDYAEALDYDKSPVEQLAASFHKDDVTRARSHMACMRFRREEMTGKIARLSGGQRAKLIFLEMVLKRANVLILDEPTRNFSPLSAPVVREALHDFGGAIISVSHDRRYLDEVCEEVWELTGTGLRKMDR